MTPVDIAARMANLRGSAMGIRVGPSFLIRWTSGFCCHSAFPTTATKTEAPHKVKVRRYSACEVHVGVLGEEPAVLGLRQV